jgi:hypothetical protein
MMRVTIDDRKRVELSGIALARCILQELSGVHQLMLNEQNLSLLGSSVYHSPNRYFIV